MLIRTYKGEEYMKDIYESLDMELVLFENEDVIVTSDTIPEQEM